MNKINIKTLEEIDTLITKSSDSANIPQYIFQNSMLWIKSSIYHTQNKILERKIIKKEF